MYSPAPKNPSPGLILETRRARVIPNAHDDTNLFGGWGPRMMR